MEKNSNKLLRGNPAEISPDLKAQANKDAMRYRIQNRAVLVSVNLKKPGATKKDRELSAVLATHYDGKDDYFPDTKKLFISDTFRRIARLDGHIRNNIVRQYTMPWTDAGRRLCPNRVIKKMHAEIQQAFEERGILVKQMSNEYDDMIEESRRGLGAAFKETDYKPKQEFIDAFDCSFIVEPIPVENDLRVKVPNDMVESLASTLQTAHHEATSGAIKSVHQRLTHVLSETIEGMNRHGVLVNKKKGKFNDFTIEKLNTLIELLPALNVTGDASLNLAYEELKKSVSGVTPQELRASQNRRTEVADASAKVMSFLSP
jgi:hypothetical protein